MLILEKTLRTVKGKRSGKQKILIIDSHKSKKLNVYRSVKKQTFNGRPTAEQLINTIK